MRMPEAGDPRVHGRRRIDRPDAIARRWSGLAEKARREGLLALEAQLDEVDDAVHEEGRCSWSSTAPTRSRRDDPRSPRSTAWRSATPERQALRDRRRLRADARDPRHRAEPRARAREPLEPGRARPLDRRRVHRHAVRRRSAPTSSSCRSATSSRGCRPRSRSIYREMMLEACSRSRPATTRACSPSGSTPSSPPASAAAAREGRARGRCGPVTPGAAGGVSGHAPAQSGGAAMRARRRARGRRRALAPHLRRHDHAADGAVHRHVGDLVREHRRSSQELQRRLKQAFNGKLIDGGQQRPDRRQPSPQPGVRRPRRASRSTRPSRSSPP